MGDATELVTVFRSADEAAEEDAKAIGELLGANGLNPTVLDDSAPSVPTGVWEVQVPAAESAQAEQLISEASTADDVVSEGNASADLDTEPVFTGSEMEINSVRGVLDDAGVASVVVGDSVLPNFSFVIRVAKQQVDRAKELIAEAQAAGPDAAEEAERAGEAPV